MTKQDILNWLESDTIEDDLDGTNEHQVMVQTEKELPPHIWETMTSHERGLNTLRAGGWLNYHLMSELGMSREETKPIGFDLGRKAFVGRDPFEEAIRLFNAQVENNS